MFTDRASGILLHVTSLPAYGGIGDFGPAAYGFVDFLASAKQRIWQVLPLNPTGYGNSPYSALSAFAGNPLLISLEKLQADCLLYAGEIEGISGHEGPVNYERAMAEKLPLITRAANRLLDETGTPRQQRLEEFKHQQGSWLCDYARFVLLRRENNYYHWRDWPKGLNSHEPAAIAKFDEQHAREMEVEFAIQFLFAEQWSELRSYCASKDVRIMGDMAIFVSYDSADVWANRERFELDASLNPVHVAGVPPDYFSATGQRWGNPVYRWDFMQAHNFDWWVARVKRQLEIYDMLRLDHFRGFEAFWSIPAEDETALNGEWVKAPGRELFARLQKELGGELPLIAEDLGVITDEVTKLRTDFDMPGMRVLQFGFGDRGGHIHLPHRYETNTVCYTGTHDNDTSLGWWQTAGEGERANVLAYLGPHPEQKEIVWSLIRCAERSIARMCILPLQDVLVLGSEGRMNTPSKPEDNWTWRFGMNDLQPWMAQQLADLAEQTDRDGYVPPSVISGDENARNKG